MTATTTTTHPKPAPEASRRFAAAGRLLHCLPAALLAFTVAACEVAAPPPPVSAPAAEEARAKAGDGWGDPADLLEAIREGRFEERVATEEALEETIPVPDPVEVSFRRGARVPDDQVPALRRIAKALATTEALHVEIVGCSDPVGSASLNRRVSESRARAVADTLLELGVREHQIGEVVGLGESCEKQQRIVRVTPRLDAVPPSA